MNSIREIADQFKGQFATAPELIAEKLQQTKAFVFDWDGVFHAGWKKKDGASAFNEVDSMGVNLLRFNHHLRHTEQAITAIITGEQNPTALEFAQREHFHAVYCGAKNKTAAIHHLQAHYGILEGEVAYFFDDVLDFSVARVSGLRIMIGRACNPLLTQYALREGLVDYLSAADAAHQALREVSELLTGLSGCYEEMLEARASYSLRYQEYFSERNALQPSFYSFREGQMQQHP